MKRNIIIDNLTLNQEVISILDDSPMMYVVDTNGGTEKMIIEEAGSGRKCRKSKRETKCIRDSDTTLVDKDTKRC